MNKVRVTKASKDTYWYSRMIGNEFELRRVEGNAAVVYWHVTDKITGLPMTHRAPILLEDCELILDEMTPSEIRDKYKDLWRGGSSKQNEADKRIVMYKERFEREVEEYKELNEKLEVIAYNLS